VIPYVEHAIRTYKLFHDTDALWADRAAAEVSLMAFCAAIHRGEEVVKR
jgi:hypothetical protein